MKFVSFRGSRLCLLWCFVVPQPLAQADESGALPHAFDAGWKGQKTCTVLYETFEVRVGQCSFAPGVGHEKHYHNPHFGFVLEGSTMLIQDETDEHEVAVETGSTWSTSSVTVHEAINIGTTTARYLIVEPRPETVPPDHSDP